MTDTEYTFQSTPPRGGRLAGVDIDDLFDAISIHAPTRGATCFEFVLLCHYQDFNPRPHAGGDDPDKIEAIAEKVFQSTPPRGGRRPPAAVHLTAIVISIHAPTRGATKAS